MDFVEFLIKSFFRVLDDFLNELFELGRCCVLGRISKFMYRSSGHVSIVEDF